MKEQLLTSEAFVKSVSNISDNVANKYLLPSIREAQEVHLEGILGECLLDKLKTLLAEGTIESQPIYKELLDRCQYFLAYEAIVEVLDKVSYKITNFGLAKSSDENLDLASMGELVKEQDLYQAKADSQVYKLQGWILKNAEKFPELDCCDCNRIKSNLYSSASCGVFLGGERGKRRR